MALVAGLYGRCLLPPPQFQLLYDPLPPPCMNVCWCRNYKSGYFENFNTGLRKVAFGPSKIHITQNQSEKGGVALSKCSFCIFLIKKNFKFLVGNG